MSTTSPDERFTTYNPVVPTTEFPALFPIFANGDLSVYIDGVERFDFTVTASYVEGVSNDAKVIMNSGVTGEVIIAGKRDPRRQNRFGFGPIAPRDLNLAFDTVQGEMQEARRDIDRSVRSEIGEPGYIIDPGLVDGDTPMKQGNRFVPGPNLPNLAASLIAEATAQANRSRDEADRSEAARDIAAGYASDAISGGMDPGLSTVVGMGAISIPAGINHFHVAGYYAAGDGGGGLAIDQDNGTPAWFTTGGPAARNWYMASTFLNIRMFGAVGNWNPETMAGADDTVAIDKAFSAAAYLKRPLFVGEGLFFHDGELNYPSGLRLVGVSRTLSQFYLYISTSEAGGRIEGANLHVSDIGHVIDLEAVLDPDGGEYGSGWTLGRYFNNGTPVETSAIFFERIGVYAAPNARYGPAHGISGLGRHANIYINDIETDGCLGASLQFHWGANGPGIGQPIVETYHPNQVRVRKVYAKNGNRVFTISSAYDISITDIRGENVKRFGEIIPGDEADSYAGNAEKLLIGGVIHISDFMITGLQPDTFGSFRITSTGTSRAEIDPSVGLGFRKVLWWKNVVLERGKLVGSDDVERVIDLTGAFGNISIRDIDATSVARLKIGVRAADTRGNMLIENFQTRSARAIEHVRSKGVKFKRIDADFRDRAGFSGDATAVSVSGNEYSSTLGVALTVGATSVVMTTSFGGAGAVNPGDVLVIDGKSVIVSGSRQFRAVETVIDIEPSTFSASVGASIYCDFFSNVDVQDSKFSLYDFGSPLNGCRSAILDGTEFRDISKIGISGAPKGGSVERVKFVRGGQYRAVDSAYPARNIILSAGSENIRIIESELGIDAEYFETLLETSSDTGGLKIEGNIFANATGPHLLLATQNNTRLTAGQYNDFSAVGHRKDGGQLTGPGTWYELKLNGILHYHGPQPPSLGPVRAGSLWTNTSPAQNSPVGAICVTSGDAGGGSWKAFGSGYGSTTQRNALTLGARDSGFCYFDTTLSKMLVWNGSSWLGA